MAIGAQKVTLNGEVAGDTRLTGEQIELGPTARLGGSLRYSSGTELVLGGTGACLLEFQRRLQAGLPADSTRAAGEVSPPTAG